MKILQLISNLGNGGAEKFVVELSNSLSYKNTVVLCSLKPVEDWMQFPKLLSKKIPLISFNKKKGFNVSIYFQLFKTLKKEKPDVVHFHLDAVLKYILPLMLLFPQIKFIHTLHSDLNHEKEKIFKQLNFFKSIIKKIKLVCISANILTEFKTKFKSFDFYLVENGIEVLKVSPQSKNVKEEIAKLKINDQTLVFISVGRLDENKNQQLLINVFKELHSENVICLIIGDDPSVNKTYLNQLQKSKSSNTFILGPKINIADYLNCADVFIMTSLNEGSPISIIEAFYFGLPVITTPAGGLKSMINKENGFITGGFKIDEMLFAIKSFIMLEKNDKEVIKKNNLQKFDSFYSMAICTKKYLSLYTQ